MDEQGTRFCHALVELGQKLQQRGLFLAVAENTGLMLVQTLIFHQRILIAGEQLTEGFIEKAPSCGSSLADASQFRKVKATITADENRRYVVPSAPGKRYSSDTKITDLFYQCCSIAQQGEDFTNHLGQIKARYDEIKEEI